MNWTNSWSQTTRLGQSFRTGTGALSKWGIFMKAIQLLQLCRPYHQCSKVPETSTLWALRNVKLQARKVYKRPAKTSITKSLLTWNNGLLSDLISESQVLIFLNSLVTKLQQSPKPSNFHPKKLRLSLPHHHISSIKETSGYHLLKSTWMSSSSRTITLKLLSCWKRTGVSETNGSRTRSNTNHLHLINHNINPPFLLLNLNRSIRNRDKSLIHTTFFGTGAKAARRTNQFQTLKLCLNLLWIWITNSGTRAHTWPRSMAIKTNSLKNPTMF